MSWEIFLQTITGSLAAIGGWFLFDLVREFKSFKAETKSDVISLKNSRADFQNTVRNAELSIALRVNEMQKIHNDFSLKIKSTLNEIENDMAQLKIMVEVASDKVGQFDSFLTKSLRLSQALNEKLKKHDKELESLKIQMGNTRIIKS
ncbi:MAG: hypothetical protein HC883_00295 [Bdellovibrionaceae bacterium]|nr:hypothetical protein [Pseudobdellovibrionaceae bacterium]